ncbi:MAG: efflux RND transporter periplasmic adaptor subunit [Gammaproteobacteria bacterium]|nr:efflux RND transporter periplasmic adaptor subunit [Gammaproteobacteria bacterium]MBU1654503.1 efflux RND transporter periplasmic adaptor subunit [Gammaproteobacteria bacterium]MBU1961321.1 efflux RND transporter periplasmic adaptor subunit [Gammaproteobacteria bacterium]
MSRNTLILPLILAAIGLSAWFLLQRPQPHYENAPGEHGEEAADEIPKGPKGGKLFSRDGYAVEVTIFETGVPPEFHVYTYLDGKPLPPEETRLEIRLTRLDGQVDRFPFTPKPDYLRGQGVVTEPHSFDVVIDAEHRGTKYQWQFASYEGRTQIDADMAGEAGIETEKAGPATLFETLTLTGRVQTVPNRLAQVRARFPGVVQSIGTNLGQRVKAGDTLAQIQSNESLENYPLKAPIDGVILARDLQVGGSTSDAPLFLIADLSQVWIELDVFGRDVARVKAGQSVAVETLDGAGFDGVIDWVSPLATHASQSVQARVVLDNAGGQMRPGQFVRGRVVVAEHRVPLAIRQAAIQGFRDFQVVFARIGDTYEVRMLELGRRNGEWAEVTGGLKPGTEYVSVNSYLIKADIEKSGASHDH